MTEKSTRQGRPGPEPLYAERDLYRQLMAQGMGNYVTGDNWGENPNRRAHRDLLEPTSCGGVFRRRGSTGVLHLLPRTRHRGNATLQR